MIGLPYWDWLQPEVNGEVFPKCLRDAFPKGLPADFFSAVADKDAKLRGLESKLGGCGVGVGVGGG